MKLSDRLLDPATDHDFVDRCVRDQWGRRERATLYLCVALRRLYRDNVHRASACSMFSDYVEQTFGIPGKLAWTFSQLGEHLERLPVTRAAMERGDVGYTKVREFATFVDVRSEREWVDFARHHSNRELEHRVREHHGSLTGKPYVPEAKVRSKLTPKGAQAVRAVQEKLTKDLDRPVKKEEMLELLSVSALEAPVAVSAEEPAPAKPVGPYLAIHLCPSCAGTWVPTPGENLPVSVDEWVESFRAGAPVVNLMGHDLCECSGAKHRADLCPERRAPDGPAASSRHVPVEVRRQVEARDGFRCRV
ncbi:MAG: hypothetical protein ABFS86_20855, partial [Planctomycetota bacterium]